MKYAIMYNLRAENKAKLDELFNSIQQKLEGKARWENAANPNSHAKGTDEKGKPVNSGMQRFKNKADAKDVYDHIAKLADKIPWISGNVHIHRCIGHDGEESGSCEIIEEFEKK